MLKNKKTVWRKIKMRKLLSLLALVMLSVLTVSLVSASSLAPKLDVTDVEINDEDVEFWASVEASGWSPDGYDVNETPLDQTDDEAVSGIVVEEGETLNVEVTLRAEDVARDVQVEADIRGYEYSDYDDLTDETHVFDMRGTETAPSTKSVRLSIDLPRELDSDRYLLRLRVTDKDHADLTYYVVLQVEAVRHGIDMVDVSLSPGSSVRAGHSLMATVLVENFGDREEDDVKVSVSIPALGISATEYVDVDSDEREDVAELFLPIPATAAAGEYEVRVTARYDGLRETLSKTFTMQVIADDYVSREMFPTDDKLVLAVGPETQAVAAGETATYGVALTNAGTRSKAYTLEVATGDWATASLSDTLVVLEPGASKVVYVNLNAAATAVPGEHSASLAVLSGDTVLETVGLRANVAAPAKAPAGDVSLRNGLEIALIVLVVLLVVIGLIIGFSRLRKDEGEEKTYY